MTGLTGPVNTERFLGQLDSREGYAQLSTFKDDLVGVSSDYKAFHGISGGWLVVGPFGPGN